MVTLLFHWVSGSRKVQMLLHYDWTHLHQVLGNPHKDVLISLQTIDQSLPNLHWEVNENLSHSFCPGGNPPSPNWLCIFPAAKGGLSFFYNIHLVRTPSLTIRPQSTIGLLLICSNHFHIAFTNDLLVPMNFPRLFLYWKFDLLMIRESDSLEGIKGWPSKNDVVDGRSLYNDECGKMV